MSSVCFFFFFELALLTFTRKISTKLSMGTHLMRPLMWPVFKITLYQRWILYCMFRFHRAVALEAEVNWAWCGLIRILKRCQSVIRLVAFHAHCNLPLTVTYWLIPLTSHPTDTWWHSAKSVTSRSFVVGIARCPDLTSNQLPNNILVQLCSGRCHCCS